jgi:hypothetical protein
LLTLYHDSQGLAAAHQSQRASENRLGLGSLNHTCLETNARITGRSEDLLAVHGLDNIGAIAGFHAVCGDRSRRHRAIHRNTVHVEVCFQRVALQTEREASNAQTQIMGQPGQNTVLKGKDLNRSYRYRRHVRTITCREIQSSAMCACSAGLVGGKLAAWQRTTQH